MGKSDFHYWVRKEKKGGKRLGKKRLTEIAQSALYEDNLKEAQIRLGKLVKGVLND